MAKKKKNKTGTAEEEFEELAKKAKEDPLFRFLAKHYSKILTVIAVLGLGFYLYNKYLETKELSARKAGDLYAGIRASYSNFIQLIKEKEEIKKEIKVKSKERKKNSSGIASSKDEGKKEKKKKTAKEELEKLKAKKEDIEKEFNKAKEALLLRLNALKQEKEPYNILALLYEAGVFSLLNQWDKALADLHQLEKIKGNEEKGRYLFEMGKFLEGRIYAAKGERDKALSIFKALVKTASYLGTPALLELSYLGESKENLSSLAQLLIKKFPEEKEVINKNLSLDLNL